MVNFQYTIPTSGYGLWSRHKTDVKVIALDVDYMNDEGDFGELRVYFDPKTWNIDEHGLIYTDRPFLKGLQAALNDFGLYGSDVSYSEQGMQGTNYVSCDVGKHFLESWEQLNSRKIA